MAEGGAPKRRIFVLLDTLMNHDYYALLQTSVPLVYALNHHLRVLFFASSRDHLGCHL